MEAVVVKWWIADLEEKVITIDLSKGADGYTPFIGENGNWWIGLTDTGIVAQANSIESIELLSTAGLSKTYRITFTYGDTFDYQVTDGEKGDKGDKGDTGDTGKSAYQSYLDTTTDNPPLSESEWANLFGDKLDIYGDGSTVGSDSADGVEPYIYFPEQGTLWNLSDWFSAIKAKIARLFELTPKFLNVISSYDTEWSFTFGGEDEWNAFVSGATDGMPMYIRLTGGYKPDKLYLGVWNEALQQIECQELKLAFYVDDTMPMYRSIDAFVTKSEYESGNVSNTTATFVEAASDALPATGETQSTLWGKVLRYFKTTSSAIEALDSAKVSVDKVVQTIGASTTDVMSQKAVSDRMARILNVTATRANANTDWTFAAFNVTEFNAVAATALNGINISVRLQGTTNGVADTDLMLPALWNNKLSQIECRELARGFYLNTGVATNRGAISNDTNTYLTRANGGYLTFNATTGFYEFRSTSTYQLGYNILDLTERDVRNAYTMTAAQIDSGVFAEVFAGNNVIRFTFYPSSNYNIKGTNTAITGISAVAQCTNIEVLCLAQGAGYIRMTGYAAYFLQNCNKIKAILGIIYHANTTQNYTILFYNCPLLESVLMQKLDTNINLSSLQVLNFSSFIFLITNSAATATRVVTHTTERLTYYREQYLLAPIGGFATLDLYAASKNITLASA